MLNQCLEEDDQLNIRTATEKLIREMQQRAFPGGINDIISRKKRDRKMASVMAMSPYVQDGLILAGGRLRRADMTLGRKHPFIIPEGEEGDALLGHLHASTEHQGRRIT